MHFLIFAFSPMAFSLSRAADSNGAESGAHKGARVHLAIFQL